MIHQLNTCNACVVTGFRVGDLSESAVSCVALLKFIRAPQDYSDVCTCMYDVGSQQSGGCCGCKAGGSSRPRD